MIEAATRSFCSGCLWLLSFHSARARPYHILTRAGCFPLKWDDTEVIPPKPWRAMLRRRPFSPRLSVAALSHLIERYRCVLTHGLAEFCRVISMECSCRWGRRRSERELFFVSLSRRDRAFSRHDCQASEPTFYSVF